MGMFGKILRRDGAVAREATQQVAIYRLSGKLETGVDRRPLLGGPLFEPESRAASLTALDVS